MEEEKKGFELTRALYKEFKSLRYQHLGMKPDRVRNCGEKFHMYDLIRESQG